MVVSDVSDIVVHNCFCIKHKNNAIELLQYSPFSGEELYGSFLYELKLLICEQILDGIDYKGEFREFSEQWVRNEADNDPIIDVSLLPKEFSQLVKNRDWYDELIISKRLHHKDGKFCYGLEGFISSCYGEDDVLPKLACVPIQYCPFCGVRLSAGFDQENWWEKEFKTFKWYQDRKMDEWADDYVDDCDWDYPDLDESDKN